jgi:hypothetical protein
LVADAPRRRARGIKERPLYNDPPGFKTCRSCETLKPVSDFDPDRRNRDGLKSWCPACHIERTLAWHRAHPAAVFRLKALRRSAEETGEVSERDWRRLLDRWGYACAYCGSKPQLLHHDHVIPVTRAGSHSIGNLLPACQQCNSSKGNLLLADWRRRTDRRRFTVEGTQRILVRL